jgi:hypothetical protein
MHRRFLTRAVLDPQHANFFVLHFNGVVSWIDLHRILGNADSRSFGHGCTSLFASFAETPTSASVGGSELRRTVAFPIGRVGVTPVARDVHGPTLRKARIDCEVVRGL